MTDQASEAVRIAEFNSLRQEIGQRTTIQQGLVALSLTVATSVSGFVVAGKDREELFVAVAFASCVFGLLWLDHNRNIGVIAKYLNDEVWVWRPSWEAYIRDHSSSRFWRLAYVSVMMAVFTGVAIAALWLATLDLAGCLWVLWAAAALLTTIVSLAFAVTLFPKPGCR